MRFIKNITYMSIGNIFRLIVAFLSSIILIRTIGILGYAIIGTIYSLTSIVSKLDISFYLSLVKTNNQSLKKVAFEQSFNSMHLLILLSNLLILIALILLSIFLSQYVYHELSLLTFYTLAILRLPFARSNNFFENALRANKNEHDVQKAIMFSVTFEFVLTIILLFIFNLGVLSVFIAAFFSASIRYFINLNNMVKFINLNFFYSTTLIMNMFSHYIIPEYFSNIMTGILFSGSLFIATIILPVQELGLLTIFVSMMRKLSDIFMPIWYHLLPVFSSTRKNILSDKQLHDLFKLPLFLTSFGTIFLFTVGRDIYNLLFGTELLGSYRLFLMIISGLLIFNGVIVANSILYSKKISSYLYVKTIVVILHLCLFIPVGKFFGLFGISFLYSFIFLLFSFGVLWKLNMKLHIDEFLMLILPFLLFIGPFKLSFILNSIIFITAVSIFVFLSRKKLLNTYLTIQKIY